MAHLFNRNVLLGVSGGIAAYKSAELVRQLQELGATVRVIMTRGAQEFITPLTLQALSGNPVHTELLDEEAEQGMGHIELARWADLLLIAPATADLIARLAAGRGDDLLTTVALATAAPKLLAPAMNQQMWRDPATTANVDTLLQRNMQMIGPAAGEQACGDVGPGRMEEPQTIAEAAAGLFSGGALAGKRVVITAGPTREALDPVRYISNHSSGKMGYALAQAAVDAGASTTLVSGPVSLPIPDGKAVDYVLFDPNNNVMKAGTFLKPVEMYRSQAQKAERYKRYRSELRDRSADEPELVAELTRLYEAWAERSGVRPWPVERREGYAPPAEPYPLTWKDLAELEGR